MYLAWDPQWVSKLNSMVYSTQVIQLRNTGKSPWICGRAPHILLKCLTYCSYPKIVIESIFNSPGQCNWASTSSEIRIRIWPVRFLDSSHATPTSIHTKRSYFGKYPPGQTIKPKSIIYCWVREHPRVYKLSLESRAIRKKKKRI